MAICAAALCGSVVPKAHHSRSREVSFMAEDRSIRTEDLENWKPASASDDGCGADCSRDEEENDCCCRSVARKSAERSRKCMLS